MVILDDMTRTAAETSELKTLRWWSVSAGR